MDPRPTSGTRAVAPEGIMTEPIEIDWIAPTCSQERHDAWLDMLALVREMEELGLIEHEQPTDTESVTIKKNSTGDDQ